MPIFKRESGGIIGGKHGHNAKLLISPKDKFSSTTLVRAQLSFIQQKEGENVLCSYDSKTKVIQALLILPAGVQDVAWLATGILIFGQGNTLYQWNPATSTGIQVWKKLEGISNISRLALSPNGKLLALVGEE